MPLKISLQHQNILQETIIYSGSLALAVEAQRRGHELYTHAPADISFQDGKVCAPLRKLEIELHPDQPLFTLGPTEKTDLTELDVILLRNQLPFDMEYVTSCHLLEGLHPKPYILNNPRSVREYSDKLLVLEMLDMAPPTLLTNDMEEICRFKDEHGTLILKPLYENGGTGIMKIDSECDNFTGIIESYAKAYDQPWMVQKFVAEIKDTGDKRFMLTQTEILDSFSRIPHEGDFRANISSGASQVHVEPTPRDLEICARVQALMKKHDLVFTSIDVIGDYVTEINTTAPAGSDIPITDPQIIKIWSKVFDAIEIKVTQQDSLNPGARKQASC